jgi:HD-like signal output (HDOD) protein
MCQIEVEMLGYDHAALGGTLVQDWNLPASLQEAVTYHHNPLAANQHPVEAAIVHVADTMIHAMQLGNSGTPFVPPFEPRAWHQVGLPISDLSLATEQIDRQYQDTVQMVLPDPLA